MVSTKKRIVELAEIHESGTSTIVSDVLLACEDHLEELMLLGRSKRFRRHADPGRNPIGETDIDERVLYRVIRRVQDEMRLEVENAEGDDERSG